MAMYPELADKWIEDERRANLNRKKKDGTFFPDVSYEGLLKIALSQKTLFDLDESLPAYNCSCTS